MFYRKAYNKLLAWKNESQGKTALLLEGARRVGKSTLVKRFAQNEYSANLVLDFSTASEEIKDLFRQYRTDIDSFYMYLQAYTGVSLPAGNSVVVFDEVQRFPTAREFIKQLVEDGRYHYIETGSLISIKTNVADIVVPSEEHSARLNPLDFEEFLLASGEDQLNDLIKSSFEELKPLPEALHRKAERLFREYMLVGGMPQAVKMYLDSKDFSKVDNVKREIINLYRNDIAQFGGRDAVRIRRVFDTLPSQLARHDKKFNLASLNVNARTREYADAFFWLSDACISTTCYGVSDPNVGLSATVNEASFKCYMGDTGLLVTQLFADNETTPHEVYRDILLDKLSFNEGMFTENAVAQQLLNGGHKLYFYSCRDDSNKDKTMEIDFLLVRGYDDAAGRMRVSPIEVKSTKRYSLVSLGKFRKQFGKRVGQQYVLHPRPLTEEDGLVRLPLYMAYCL